MRKHYMTLCIRNNTEVTHIIRDNKLEITFEQAVNGGFNTLVMLEDGTILSNEGFNSSDIAFFRDFLCRNVSVMKEEALGVGCFA